MISAVLTHLLGPVRSRRGTGAVCAALAFAAAGCASHTGEQAAAGTAGTTATPAAVRAAAPATTGRTATTPTTSATTSATAARVPVTTVAPAPHGGNVHRHVPAGIAHSAAPVPLAQPASFGRGVSVRVIRHATVDAQAHGPGEISGPATALTIRFTNASRRTVDLSHVVVADQDAQGTPLLPVSSRPARPVAGSLGPHAAKTAVYLFTLPQRRHNPYTITISYATTSPAVRLVGAAA